MASVYNSEGALAPEDRDLKFLMINPWGYVTVESLEELEANGVKSRHWTEEDRFVEWYVAVKYTKYLMLVFLITKSIMY